MAKWSKDEKSWERQPRESIQAFEAFDLYCQMGADRSIRRVAKELSKSETLIKRWSSTWSWQKRSRDYDNELKRQEFEEQRKSLKKMQQRQIQTAMLLQKKAVEALDKLQFDDLKPGDILRFISEGAKLERETRQESTSTTKTEMGTPGGGGGSLADIVISAYKRRMEDENA